jgi:HlyD family secretion protein
VEPGQIVQPGKALLTLALAGPTQFKAQVDERFLQQLAIGQPGWVVADAYPGERLAARVSAIAPSIDPQRGAVEVTLTLAQPAPDFLREDMTLSVEVETARREQALTLPLSALRPAMAGQDEVLVLHEGRAQARQVRLGLRNLQAVEVTDGLAAGDTVLLGEGISAGQRVSPHLLTANELALHQNRVSGASAATALTNAMGR